MKTCLLFAGKRPGGKVLGKTEIHWTKLRNVSWDRPLVVKLAKPDGKYAYGSIVG